MHIGLGLGIGGQRRAVTAALAATALGDLSGNNPGALPTYYYSADAPDFEATPVIRTGTDNDGETGTGWSTSGTTRKSSTANDIISWSGTFCSFGLDTVNGAGQGTVAWSLDGGAYTNLNLATKVAGIPYGVTNFARGAHTITLKVVSGTVQINRFLAV